MNSIQQVELNNKKRGGNAVDAESVRKKKKSDVPKNLSDDVGAYKKCEVMSANFLNLYSLRVLLDRSVVDAYLNSNTKFNIKPLNSKDTIEKIIQKRSPKCIVKSETGRPKKQTTLLDFFKLQDRNNRQCDPTYLNKKINTTVQSTSCQDDLKIKNEIKDEPTDGIGVLDSIPTFIVDNLSINKTSQLNNILTNKDPTMEMESEIKHENPLTIDDSINDNDEKPIILENNVDDHEMVSHKVTNRLTINLTKYNCHDCGYKCSNKDKLTRHIKKHFKVKAKRRKLKVKHNCLKCGKEFKMTLPLKQHELICGILFYKCELCDKKYDKWKLLKHHVNSHHVGEMEIRQLNKMCRVAWTKGREFKVAVREAVIAEKSAMKEKHRKIVKKDENKKMFLYHRIQFYCVDCKISFNRPDEMKVDVKNCLECEKELVPKCRKCGKLFASMDSAYAHLEHVCYPLKYFKCNGCNYVSTRKQAFQIHVKKYHPELVSQTREQISAVNQEDNEIHQDVFDSRASENSTSIFKKIPRGRIYTCNDCNFKAFQKNDLALHIFNDHGVDPDVMYCTKCGRVFLLLRSFNEHKLICGLMSYKCKYCHLRWSVPNGYIRKHLITIHMEEIESNNEIIDVLYDQILNSGRESRTKDLKSIHHQKRINGEINEGPLIKTEDEIKQYCEKCKETTDVTRMKFNWIVQNCQNCGTSLKSKCPTCQKLFPTTRAAKAHVQHVCKPRQYFKCEECDYKNSRESLVLDHFKRLHAKQGETKSQCSTDFPNNNEPLDTKDFFILDDSIIPKDNLKNLSHGFTYYCDNCNYKTFRKGAIRAHILNQHPVHLNFHHCPKCSKLYKDPRALEEHKLTCGLMNYKCKFCTKRWSNTKGTIKVHLMKVHEEEMRSENLEMVHDEILREAREMRVKILESLRAKQSNPGTDNKVALTMDNKMRLYCEKCNEKYDKIRRKKNSIIKFCPKCGSKVQYQCLKCEKLYTKFRSLGSHLGTVCYARNFYKCTDCELVSTKMGIIRRHMQRVHNKSVPDNLDELKVDEKKGDSKSISRGVIYNCNDCNYKSYLKNEIRLHILSIHGAGANLHFCPFCSYIFERLESLQNHKLTCGLMCFKCKYCKKRWPHTESIKDHLKSHKKEIETVDLHEDHKKIVKEARETRKKIRKAYREKVKATGNFENDVMIATRELIKQQQMEQGYRVRMT